MPLRYIVCYSLVVTLAVCLASAGSFPLDNKTTQPAPKVTTDEPSLADLSGVYYCRGKEPDGTSYEGMVSLMALRDGYIVSWVIGRAHTVGIGMRSGDQLTVGWNGGPENPIRGVSSYKIKGKVLEGKFQTLPGSGRSREETLTFLRAYEIPLRIIEEK